MLVRRLLLAAAILPLLAGCVFFEGPVSRKMERSPNFKAGYSDGCATASTKSANYREQQSVTKDKALFESDKAYRAGWSAGYTGCRPMFGNEASRGPVPDPYPPH